MKKTIITISREFGSGGRTVGMLLAEELGINCYDRALIEKAAELSGMSPDFIENVEQKASNSFFSTCHRLHTPLSLRSSPMKRTRTRPTGPSSPRPRSSAR